MAEKEKCGQESKSKVLLGYMLMEKIVSCYLMPFVSREQAFAGQFTPKPPDPLRFSSVGHNMQSHDLQLTALTQNCSNKKPVCKPIKKLCFPYTTNLYGLYFMGQGE